MVLPVQALGTERKVILVLERRDVVGGCSNIRIFTRL